MIFGRNRCFRLLLICLLVVANVGAIAQDNNGHDKLISLLSGFAQIESSSVYFKEEKFINTHKNVIHVSGGLFYRKPDYLKKQIDEPYVEILEIRGDALSLTDYEGFTQKISLQDTPEIKLYINAFRGFLSGNYAMLEKNFSMIYQGQSTHWKVSFIPRHQTTGQALKSVVFEGREFSIRKIEITNQDNKSILNLHDKK